MSLNQYRFADVTVFVFLAFATSFISEFLYKEMESTLVYINFGLLVSLIAIVRWGFVGTLAYLFSGIPLLIYRSGESTFIFQIAFYVLSNGSLILLVVFFKWVKRYKIHQSVKYSLIYLVISFTIITISKGLMLSFLGLNFYISAYSYLIAEILNFVITVIVFLVINQFSEGLIIDMKYYIENIQGEKDHDV